MNIVFQGFQLEANEGLTLDAFFKHLAESNEGDFTFAHKKRIFLFNDSIDNDYYVGGIITIKDYKKFLELKQGDVDITLEIKEVTSGNHLADFNFFAINKKTSTGIYQYYHHSMSMNQYGIFLRDIYRAFSDECRDNELKSLLQERGKKKKEKEIRSKYFKSLKLIPLYRRDTFNEMVDSLAKITHFSFDLCSLGAEDNEFSPLSDFAEKVKHSVTFRQNSILAEVKSRIKNFIQNRDISTGMVKGMDADGIERIYTLANSPETFKENDFDEMISGLDRLNLSNLSENNIVKMLIETAHEYRECFEIPRR